MIKNLENPNELQEISFKQELKGLEMEVKSNQTKDDGKWIERPSVPREKRSLLEKYEGKTSLSDAEFKTYMEYINKYKTYLDLRNLTKITDYQAKEIAKNGKTQTLNLGNLKSITDKQAEILGKVEYLTLDGLTSITDKQAESLGEVKYLGLNGIKNITDKQAELLSKVTGRLELSGLSHITDKQAEILSKVGCCNLNGLISLTDKQAEFLSNVESLGINKDVVTPRQKEILLKKQDYYINVSKDGTGGYSRRSNVVW